MENIPQDRHIITKACIGSGKGNDVVAGELGNWLPAEPAFPENIRQVGLDGFLFPVGPCGDLRACEQKSGKAVGMFAPSEDVDLVILWPLGGRWIGIDASIT